MQGRIRSYAAVYNWHIALYNRLTYNFEVTAAT